MPSSWQSTSAQRWRRRHKKEDFAKVLNGYDVVLNSLGKDTLEKSLQVLKPGGTLISISGPPDLAFAKDSGFNWFVQQVMRLMSLGIRRKAKRHGINYSFVFMRANGGQLSKITSLIESGVIRQVVDRIFPFQATNEGGMKQVCRNDRPRVNPAY